MNQLKRAQQHKQREGGKDEVEKIKEKVKEYMSKGWCTFQAQSKCNDSESRNSEPHGDAIHQEVEFNQEGSKRFNFLKDEFILDTGSTISAMIVNENLVTNIRKSATPIVMTTNAGIKVLDTEAEIINFGKAMFDTTQMANVFGFSHLVENFRVTYDSSVEDAFVVHTDCGKIKFVNKERLYVFQPSEKYLELVQNIKKLESTERKDAKEKKVRFETQEHQSKTKDVSDETKEPPQSTKICQVIPSVSENMMKYTKQQIKRAGRVRVTYRTLGSLTVENFKNILKQNLIKNCPVTIKDVEIAEDIFGPNISALKGRSTRERPPVITSNQMEVPRELVYNWDNLTRASTICTCRDKFF